MSKLRSIYGMGLRNTTAMHPMEAGINGFYIKDFLSH